MDNFEIEIGVLVQRLHRVVPESRILGGYVDNVVNSSAV